jgi:hypothetical protein
VILAKRELPADVVSGPPPLTDAAAVPQTAGQAAADLQVQEQPALVRGRDWGQLKRRAAAGSALTEAAVLMLATS